MPTRETLHRRAGRPIRVTALATALLLGCAGTTFAQGYPLWEAGGTLLNHGFGFRLAPAGDVNSDGVPDLLVAGFGGTNYIGTVDVLSGTDGAPLLALTGTAPYDYFYASVASTGDIDGDGVPDFVVGASGASPGGIQEAGRATVFSAATGAVLLSVDGTTPYDNLGNAAAGPGDLNGDGIPDVLVGVRGFDPAGLTDAGQVRAVSGANGQVLYTVDGSSVGEWFGFVLDAVQDVDGNGVPDFIVGIPTLGAAGTAKILSGVDGATLLEFTGSGSYSPGTLWGRFGSTVAGVGDVDADGTPDVVVGAPYAASGLVCQAGQATVFSGATGSALLSFSGTLPSDRLGSSVARAGDVNGDGFADILVGIPEIFCQLCGCGSPYWQPMTGRATVYSGANGAALVTVSGESLYDAMGTAVCGPGDLDGDGLPDLAVGATGVNGPFPYSGQVKAVSFAGIPAGSFLFGSGCPGSGGVVPLVQTAGGAPTVGNGAFSIVLSKALGGTAALLMVGTSSQSWSGTPLPLDLTPWGMPGCSLLVAPDVLVPAVTSGIGPGAGAAVVPTPIPPIAAPWLVGAFVHFQWYVVDPGPFPLPGSLTARLRVLVLP